MMCIVYTHVYYNSIMNIDWVKREPEPEYAFCGATHPMKVKPHG